MTAAATLTALERRYYERLEHFTDLCIGLARAGAPYFAVVLCHELFRFHYPTEPYAGVTNDRDPVGDAVARIDRLIALGEQFAGAVTPYAFEPLAAVGGMRWEEERLERTTSNLYSELWKAFDRQTLTGEAVALVRARIPQPVVDAYIAGRNVLDMGCGSGRYTLALAALGAAHATGIDVQGRSFEAARAWAVEHGVKAEFREGNVLVLPFPDASFDFVFCNGVIHHSASIEQGLREIARVLKPGGASFLYLYAAGGIFWNTRLALRAVFKEIPLDYSKAVLQLIGMPSNRFIFCDTWYVPVETHTTTASLESMLHGTGFTFEKVPGRNAFDLDGILATGTVSGAREMWGDGEHRYILKKSAR